ncbi:hypothetical protein C2E23DRAFT_858336 [Lenzites betulinus]|nr:hypothetical protein C2E23DRAFT_858336 [Lenzites betulinus]
MGDVGTPGMEAWGENVFQAPQAAPNGMPAQQPPPEGATTPNNPPPPPAASNDPLDRMNLLLESVVHIGHAAGNAHQEQVITRQALEALVHRLETLSAGAPTTAGGSSGPPRGNVRVRDPRVFNGKATEVDAFLEEVDAAILLQPALRDADETVKCHYFVSWLGDGGPRSWLKAMKNRVLRVHARTPGRASRRGEDAYSAVPWARRGKARVGAEGALERGEFPHRAMRADIDMFSPIPSRAGCGLARVPGGERGEPLRYLQLFAFRIFVGTWSLRGQVSLGTQTLSIPNV